MFCSWTASVAWGFSGKLPCTVFSKVVHGNESLIMAFLSIPILATQTRDIEAWHPRADSLPPPLASTNPRENLSYAEKATGVGSLTQNPSFASKYLRHSSTASNGTTKMGCTSPTASSSSHTFCPSYLPCTLQ